MTYVCVQLFVRDVVCGRRLCYLLQCVYVKQFHMHLVLELPLGFGERKEIIVQFCEFFEHSLIISHSGF